MTPIHEFEEALSVEVENKEVATVGGLITSELGRIPVIQEKLRLNGLDIAITEVDEKRVDFDIAAIQETHRVFDIGPKTIEKYSTIINNSQNIFITGPLGWFENKEFAKGTMEILRKISTSTAKSITSGGHLSAAVEQLDTKNNIDHVSTAGGALITFISGKKLPLLEALEISQNKFRASD